MSESLVSVGIDVGTTTTQLVVSELTVENRAGGFSVPRLEITHRKLRYQSPVSFTPLEGPDRVDGQALRAFVQAQYQLAGITKEQVDTGAVIVTGETARRENARQVQAALSGLAGSFVVAAAGPKLESELAARGAGAVEWSENLEGPVLHMDIGGGTANLALIEKGRILRTGCLDVGGRLVRRDEQGRVTYVSPVLKGLTALTPGQPARENQVEALVQLLTEGLEMAAGLRERTPLLDRLSTREAGAPFLPCKAEGISFSGGVADCILREHPPNCFGDIGPELGQAIGKSRLCRGRYRLGAQTVRATVIGAGCHSTCLSGSTVFWQDLELPLRDLSVVELDDREQTDPTAIARKLAAREEEQVLLALPGYPAPGYGQIMTLARAIAAGVGHREVLVCVEGDCAKALGQSLGLLLPGRPCLCIDRLRLEAGSYLDVGRPVGPAVPVAVKLLALSR